MMIADVIVRTSLDASSVARRLIDFTRPTTTINFEPTDFRRLLAEIARQEREARRTGVRWSLDLREVPLVSANAKQVRALLGHLIDNAYEAMGEAEGEIALSTDVDSRGWVVIELADTGVGMTADVHKHAIEPFFTTKPGHFGVGLTIANGIWRRHKGTLGVLTQPGEGVRVRLFIEPNATTVNA
jgi:signal transduction histidine kinase